MSSQIPRRTIDALRHQCNLSIEIFGITCELYIPSNKTDVEPLDIYVVPTDYEYTKYTCNVFIEWKPSTYRLKNMGVYVENELSILVRLPNRAYNTDGNQVNIDVLTGSYIKVPLEYVPSNMQKYSEFELVDIVIANMHDAVVVKTFKAVPRRFPEPSNRETI